MNMFMYLYMLVGIYLEKNIWVLWDKKHCEKAGRTNFGLEHPQVKISTVAYPRKFCRFSKLPLD